MHRRRITTALGIGATLALPLLVLGASRTAPAQPPFAERLTELAGLENVARVATGIYRGNQPTHDGLRTLKSLGIRTVINLRHYHGKGEGEDCRTLDLDYVHLPLASTDEPNDMDVGRFLAIVTDPKRQPVYFHCWRGKDRTGMMCAVYRIAVEGWSAEDALAEMDAFGAFKGYHALHHYVQRIAGEPTLVWRQARTP